MPREHDHPQAAAATTTPEDLEFGVVDKSPQQVEQNSAESSPTTTTPLPLENKQQHHEPAAGEQATREAKTTTTMTTMTTTTTPADVVSRVGSSKKKKVFHSDPVSLVATKSLVPNEEEEDEDQHDQHAPFVAAGEQAAAAARPAPDLDDERVVVTFRVVRSPGSPPPSAAAPRSPPSSSLCSPILPSSLRGEFSPRPAPGDAADERGADAERARSPSPTPPRSSRQEGGRSLLVPSYLSYVFSDENDDFSSTSGSSVSPPSTRMPLLDFDLDPDFDDELGFVAGYLSSRRKVDLLCEKKSPTDKTELSSPHAVDRSISTEKSYSKAKEGMIADLPFAMFLAFSSSTLERDRDYMAVRLQGGLSSSTAEDLDPLSSGSLGTGTFRGGAERRSSGGERSQRSGTGSIRGGGAERSSSGERSQRSGVGEDRSFRQPVKGTDSSGEQNTGRRQKQSMFGGGV